MIDRGGRGLVPAPLVSLPTGCRGGPPHNPRSVQFLTSYSAKQARRRARQRFLIVVASDQHQDMIRFIEQHDRSHGAGAGRKN